MIREIQQRVNRERGGGQTYKHIQNSFVRDLENWINSPSTSVDNIVDTFFEASRRSIHHIAQPITGAVAAGVTSDVLLVLPPWSTRIQRTDQELAQRLCSVRVDLAHRIDSTEGRIIQNTSTNPAFNRGNSPIYEPGNGDQRVRSYRLQVTNLTNETKNYHNEWYGLRGFEDYLPSSARNTGFILDIDLDAFVSNGKRDNSIVEPLSYGRRDSTNHVFTTEGDLRSGIALDEMVRIKERINIFFRRLQDAKDAGMCPRIITIADSTELTRASEE